MRQSDFELCTNSPLYLNEEQRVRRKRLLAEMNMDDWDTSRVKQRLSLYPNKIVPDEEFEQAEKENEALRRRRNCRTWRPEHNLICVCLSILI